MIQWTCLLLQNCLPAMWAILPAVTIMPTPSSASSWSALCLLLRIAHKNIWSVFSLSLLNSTYRSSIRDVKDRKEWLGPTEPTLRGRRREGTPMELSEKQRLNQSKGAVLRAEWSRILIAKTFESSMIYHGRLPPTESSRADWLPARWPLVLSCVTANTTHCDWFARCFNGLVILEDMYLCGNKSSPCCVFCEEYALFHSAVLIGFFLCSECKKPTNELPVRFDLLCLIIRKSFVQDPSNINVSYSALRNWLTPSCLWLTPHPPAQIACLASAWCLR